MALFKSQTFVTSNLFRQFFPQSWVVFSLICTDQHSAKFPRKMSEYLQSFISITSFFSGFVQSMLVSLISLNSQIILLNSENLSDFAWDSPPSSVAWKLSQYFKLDQSLDSSYLFFIPQRSLSFIA